MKQCPKCRQTYSYDTIFCLSDGTPLVFINDSSEEVTVINPNQEEVTIFNPNAPTSEEITIVRPAESIQPPARPGVSPIFAYLSVGLLVLLILGGIILAGIFVISRMSGGNTNSEIAKVTNKMDNGQNKIDDQQANLREQQDQLEKEKQRLANERQKIEEQKNKPVPTPPIISTPPATATPPPSYPSQPTARIKFGRGRVAESISGKVYTQRSFVLEASSGQYLSASVTGGGCVTFSNGGTSVGYATVSGDNRLTLVNNCDKEASFRMTVSIR